MKWRYLLWPVAVLYDLVTRIRNHLYNIGHKPSFSFEVPVVSIGNLNIGGSGKTPMIEYLVRLLGGPHQIATLSRGYGRKTRGLRFAAKGDNAATIGDEPFQLFRKFANIRVVVAEDRAFAIPYILNEHPDVSLVLLDDAFQHRAVRPQLSILLTEYAQPFISDLILPAGNLREARTGARRADIVVVTKCPQHITDEVHLVDEIRKYCGNKPVFFSSIKYSQPISFGSQPNAGNHVVLVTGIANPGPFVSYMKTMSTVIRHFQFGDHHRYTMDEVSEIVAFAEKENASIMTTEKDMVRLQSDGCSEIVRKNPFFFVPIETTILKNGSEFDDLVRRRLNGD